MNSLNSENKNHYKMYKSGKQWIYAAITTTAVIAGTSMFVSSTVNADTTTQPAVAAPVTGQTTSQAVEVTTPKQDTTTSASDVKTAVANNATTTPASTTTTSDKTDVNADTSKNDTNTTTVKDTKTTDTSTNKDVKTSDSSNAKVIVNASSPITSTPTKSDNDKGNPEVKSDSVNSDVSKKSDNDTKNVEQDAPKVAQNAFVSSNNTNDNTNSQSSTDNPDAKENVYVKKNAVVYTDAQGQDIAGVNQDYNTSAIIVNNVFNGRVPVVITNRNLEGYISVDDYTSSPQFFNDSYGTSHYTRWDLDQIPDALNNPDFRAPQYDRNQLGSNIPSATVMDPTTHEEKQIFVWDSWPLQDPNGQMSNYHGYYIVFGLTAPEGVDQNANAKIGAFAQKVGTKDDGIDSWQYLGNVFKTHLDGSSSDDPYLKNLVGEWSGSAVMTNPDDDTVRIFYTNAAPVNGGNQQVLTTAQISLIPKDGEWDNGLAIDQSKTTDHKSIFAGDGDKYQNLSELGAPVNGFPDNFCLRDPHYVEADGHKYLVFEGNTGVQDGFQGINNIYNEAYFGGSYDYFMKSHNWLTQFPNSLEYGKAINANAALGIVELNDDFTVKTVMNPLLTANAVNDEFERPDIFEHDGKWYLFTVNRGERMASSIANVTGDTHNYMSYMMGFVSDDGIAGHYKPLNGNGLVLASDMNWTDPNFMYSFYVIPPVDEKSNDFVVTSYLGNRSFAPSFLMNIEGDNTKILNYKVLNQGAVVNSDNYYKAEAQPVPVFDGASINDGTVISMFGCGPLVVIPPKATENTPNETPGETVKKTIETNTPTPGTETPVPGTETPTPGTETNVPGLGQSEDTPTRSGQTHFVTLPQTGQNADASVMAIIGSIMLGMLGLFGLGKRRN